MSTQDYRTYQMTGLALGPALFAAVLVLPPPGGLSPEGWATAGLAAWMAVWWATEALPLAATALLPLVLLPFLGIFDVQKAAAPFANPLIFLFLGGFLLAMAVQRWDLHRRIALNIVLRVGQRPSSLVAGAMLATAVLSMWISNTATTMMMLPIAASLVAVMQANAPAGERDPTNFGTAMMLGIAYAASIGGFATLIGSPPNALVASYLLQTFGTEVSFVRWMTIGTPIACVMLPLAWLVLTRLVFSFSDARPAEPQGSVSAMLAAMGPMSAPEMRVAAVVALVAAGWMLQPLLATLLGKGTITDTGVAIAGAVALFVIPADWKGKVFLLDWQTARNLPWEILLLFGGGLSLAQAIDQSGLAAWIGSGMAIFGGGPTFLLIGGVAVCVIFLTELTSNTATTAAFLPVAGALAVGTELAPLLVAAPVALAASAAFMLPVATPPNAIVFGSGHVRLPQMIRAGFLLNIAGITIITAGVLLLARGA